MSSDSSESEYYSNDTATENDTDSESDFEIVCTGDLETSGCSLPFDPAALENIILKISDTFNLRVVMNNNRMKSAVMVTTGLTLAGSLIGKHYGGKVGAAFGGAVGGAIGVGVVMLSMRQVWEDIKSQLSELFELVYDYLAGLGFEDYKKAAMFLVKNRSSSSQLAMIIVETVSSVLGKVVLSTPAS